MTLKNLLEYFEKYYGEKYSGVLLDTMAAYLSGYSPEFYKTIAEVMIKRFSRIYNKVPGPAEIEAHMEEIIESMPQPKYLPDRDPEILNEARDKSLIEEFRRARREKHEVRV